MVEEWVLAPFQEPGPDSDDPEVMAQWHEREAAALNLLCGHAWLGGDRDNADLMAQEAAGLSMAAVRLRGVETSQEFVTEYVRLWMHRLNGPADDG